MPRGSVPQELVVGAIAVRTRRVAGVCAYGGRVYSSTVGVYRRKTVTLNGSKRRSYPPPNDREYSSARHTLPDAREAKQGT